MHIFTTKSISVSITKRTEITASLQLSVNTQFVPLMHIVAKSKSISRKTLWNTYLVARRSKIEICWSQPVLSRSQNLASKTKQPFYRGTRRKCCKTASVSEDICKTMNDSGSVSQEHVNFCSSICVFCWLCFKTEEVIFVTGTPADVVAILWCGCCL